MLVAVASMAQTSNGFVSIMSVDPTAEQDKLMYISPNDIETEAAGRTQKIVTSTGYIPGFPIAFCMQHFLVECVASSEDFNKGVTENVYLLNGAVKAMPVMPARAKVVGLALPGNYDDTEPNSNFVYNLYSYLFIKNLKEPSNNPPYKDVFYSDLLKENIGSFGDDRYFYKPENNYLQAISKGDRLLRPIDSQDVEHHYVLDMTFKSPFQYDGDFIHLAIELSPADNKGDESQASNAYATRFYFPNTQSSFSDATIYHTKREGGSVTSEFNFYSDPQSKANVIEGLKNYLKAQSTDDHPIPDYIAEQSATIAANNLFDYFNFQNKILPAFQLTYYTNDIRGTVLDINPDPEGNPKPIVEDITKPNVDVQDQPHGYPLIRLYDETDKKYIKPDGVENLNSMCGAEVNADGSFCFSNLDHTHVYTLSAASSTCGYQEKTINFDTGISQAKALDVDNAFKNDLVCDIRMLQDTGVVTAITDVTASTSPVAVDYYNVAGVRSATPFSGVNIVVTHYSDGTTSTAKLIK